MPIIALFFRNSRRTLSPWEQTRPLQPPKNRQQSPTQWVLRVKTLVSSQGLPIEIWVPSSLPLAPTTRTPHTPAGNRLNSEHRGRIKGQNRKQRSTEPHGKRWELQPWLQGRPQAWCHYDQDTVGNHDEEEHGAVLTEGLHERMPGVVHCERVDLEGENQGRTEVGG